MIYGNQSEKIWKYTIMANRRSVSLPDGCTSFQVHYWNRKLSQELPFYVYCFEETARTLPRGFRCSCNPFLLLVVLESGALRYTAGARSHTLVPGEILIVPRSGEYGFESFSSGGAYRKLVLEMRGGGLELLTESLRLNRFSCYPLPDPGRTIREFRRIGSLLAGGRTADVPRIMGKAQELLVTFSMLACPAPERPALLQRAQAFLESNLAMPGVLAKMARELHVSRSTLGRLFREHLGCSPMEYRFRRRMESAEYLLKNADCSVKETAFRLGYCNQFHFSSEFKRWKGCSPAEYRKNRPEVI